MLVTGVVGVAVFYVIIMAVGIWAGNKQRGHSEETVMLAGRQLGLVVGTFTLVATWVGAGFISGIPEVVYTNGLVWCLVPLGYSASFLVGGLLFASPMRLAGHVTLMDPFQEAYGEKIGAILFVPALLGDVFWSAAILAALGSTLSVVLNLNANAAVVVSAVVAATYTMLGGLYSVAYTDVIQLLCIVLGMLISIPFAWNHPEAWHGSSQDLGNWMGEVKPEEWGEWIDVLLLLVFGGIPWQSYFQRILSMKTIGAAKVMSFASFVCCLLMAVPTITIGIIAKETDWTKVSGFERNITSFESPFVLPLVLRYLTPEWVAFIGIGAISAAVMSSADSSFLASSALFARNIYRVILRPKASHTEVIWVLRISVVALAIIASLIALTCRSIYYLSLLCSDLIYVLLFPHLLLTVYWRNGVHPVGCIVSFIIGLFLRISFGEPGLNLPSLINLVYTTEIGVIYTLPRRTICMLVTLFTHMIVSRLMRIYENSRWNLECRRAREEVQLTLEET